MKIAICKLVEVSINKYQTLCIICAMIKRRAEMKQNIVFSRAWQCRWKMWGSEPRTLTGKGSQSPTAFWRWKTEASGGRSATRTGRRWTPGSSVACTASPGRNALICDPTSEWWCRPKWTFKQEWLDSFCHVMDLQLSTCAAGRWNDRKLLRRDWRLTLWCQTVLFSPIKFYSQLIKDV